MVTPPLTKANTLYVNVPGNKQIQNKIPYRLLFIFSAICRLTAAVHISNYTHALIELSKVIYSGNVFYMYVFVKKLFIEY